MRVLGADPGKTGALAFLTLEHGSVADLKLADLADFHCRVGSRSVLDPYALARVVDAELKDGIDLAVLEQGGVRPQNGRVGAAQFWLGLGTIRGIIAAYFIPLVAVPPATWKRSLRIPADKDASRLRASAMFPRWSDQWSRVKDHGRAEAALIALYGANQLPALEALKTA